MGTPVCCIVECVALCEMGICNPLPGPGCLLCVFCGGGGNPTSAPVCAPFDGPTPTFTPSVPTMSPCQELNPNNWICGTQTPCAPVPTPGTPNVPNPFSQFGNTLAKAGASLFGPSTGASGSQLGTSLLDLLKSSVSTGVLPGTVLAALGYKCASDYNTKVQNAYSSNLAAIQNYQNLYSSGQGLPQLQLSNNAGNLALAAPGATMANAPLRTQQNVVAKPMAKDGGIMSVRKNYADGNVASMMPCQPTTPSSGDWMSPGIWDSSSVDPTNNSSLDALLKLIEPKNSIIKMPYPMRNSPTYNYAKGGEVKKPLGIAKLVNKIKQEPDIEEKKGILKTKINQIKKSDPKMFEQIKKLTQNLHIKNAANLAKQKTYSDTLKKVKLLRITDPVKHKMLAQSVLSKPRNIPRINQAMGSPMEGLNYSSSGNPIANAIAPSIMPNGIAAIQPAMQRNLQQALRGNPALVAKLAQLRNTQQGFGKKDGGRAHYAMGTPPMGAVNQNPNPTQPGGVNFDHIIAGGPYHSPIPNNPNQMQPGQFYPGGNVSGQIPGSPGYIPPNQMQPGQVYPGGNPNGPLFSPMPNYNPNPTQPGQVYPGGNPNGPLFSPMPNYNPNPTQPGGVNFDHIIAGRPYHSPINNYNPNQMQQGKLIGQVPLNQQIPGQFYPLISPINQPNQMQPVAGGGGIMGYATGGSIPEIDYRDGGGYVPPIGKKERADDIPAMLSNNEFVFTANAVRNAGGGDVKKGANKMYALMKHLESKK
jgi:hypothetical protein